MGGVLNKFRIVYSTNISKNKQFILRDKNILHNVQKLEKMDKLLNKGDKVIYIDPKDPERNGLEAVVTKLNFSIL